MKNIFTVYKSKKNIYIHKVPLYLINPLNDTYIYIKVKHVYFKLAFEASPGTVTVLYLFWELWKLQYMDSLVFFSCSILRAGFRQTERGVTWTFPRENFFIALC